MRIVLASPLYPPEIAQPAPYVKELAKRLSKLHEVTIVTYSSMPEKVPNVRILVTNKQYPLMLRLISYFFTLLRAARDADIVYAINGASVELPAAFATFFVRRHIVFCIVDVAAHERTKHSVILRSIERLAYARAKRIITDTPHERPEILPLEPFPTEQMTAYEQSWDAHLRILEETFNYAT